MSAGEVRKDVEARLKKLETFAFLAKGAVAILGAAAGISLPFLIPHVLKLGTDLAALNATVNAKVPAIEANHAELQKRHAELLANYGQLRTRVVVLHDRQGGGPIPEAIVYWGKVLRRTDDTITILPDDEGEPSTQFRLDPEVRVRLDEKKVVSLDDIKAGATVGIFPQDGKAVSIELRSR